MSDEQGMDILSPGAIEEHQQQAQRGRAHKIWSYSDTGHELTVEEQIFCRSYIIDRNPVAAMRRIGYGPEMSNQSVKYRAERMLANTEVQGCIEALAQRMMQHLDITAEKVNQQMAAVAFSDISQIMEFDHNGVKMIHSKYWTPEQRAAIKSVKMGKEGIIVEFHDKMRALEFLGKQVGAADSDSEIARAAAEGAAAAAINKILDITGRMRPAQIEEQPSSIQ